MKRKKNYCSSKHPNYVTYTPYFKGGKKQRGWICETLAPPNHSVVDFHALYTALTG